jgi:hypothetical protein
MTGIAQEQMTRFSVLLSDANRQLQIADHLLTVTYPMVKHPKLLLSVIEHCRRAIEDAAQAVVEFYVEKGSYEIPVHARTDMLAAFSDLVKIRHPGIAAEQDALKLCHDFRQTLQQHKDSHTTFKRDEKLVIASEGFEYLKEITPEELKRSLHTLKQFVHGANQHVGEV